LKIIWQSKDSHSRNQTKLEREEWRIRQKIDELFAIEQGLCRRQRDIHSQWLQRQGHPLLERQSGGMKRVRARIRGMSRSGNYEEQNIREEAASQVEELWEALD
jgi:hypothetical protein